MSICRWQTEGLQFGCTGCGRCCQTEGEVWFDTDEFYDLAIHLNIPFQTALDQYTSTITGGWVKLKNKFIDDIENDQCVFLCNDDNKTCTVYNVRPTQCRTYPYWPSLLVNRGSWDNEAVVPDEKEGENNRH